jgi:hypothetical protein
MYISNVIQDISQPSLNAVDAYIWHASRVGVNALR